MSRGVRGCGARVDFASPGFQGALACVLTFLSSGAEGPRLFRGTRLELLVCVRGPGAALDGTSATRRLRGRARPYFRVNVFTV